MSTPEEDENHAAKLDAETLKLRAKAKQVRTQDEAISTPVQPPSPKPEPKPEPGMSQAEYQAFLTAYNTKLIDGMAHSEAESQNTKQE